MEKKESREKMEKVVVDDGGKKLEEETKPAPVCFKKPAEDSPLFPFTSEQGLQRPEDKALSLISWMGMVELQRG